MSLAKKSSILRGDLRERMELTCFEVVYRAHGKGNQKSVRGTIFQNRYDSSGQK